LSGYPKYDLLHKNLFELFVDPAAARTILRDVMQGRQASRQGDLRKADTSLVPVVLSAVELSLMGKRFIQSVVRDISSEAQLGRLLAEKDREISALKAQLDSKNY
jgi:hypothetical protein